MDATVIILIVFINNFFWIRCRRRRRQRVLLVANNPLVCTPIRRLLHNSEYEITAGGFNLSELRVRPCVYYHAIILGD